MRRGMSVVKGQSGAVSWGLTPGTGYGRKAGNHPRRVAKKAAVMWVLRATVTIGHLCLRNSAWACNVRNSVW